MSQFDDANSIDRLKIDTRLRLNESDIRIRNFAFREKDQARSDFLGQLDRMTQTDGHATTTANSALRLDTFDVDFGTLAAGILERGPEAPHLAQAKRRIGERSFRDALEPLGKVLVLAPGHHEGHYLQAVCHHELRDWVRALRALRPLRDQVLKNRQATRVDALKAEIRRAMLPVVLRQNAEQIKAKQYDQVIQAMTEIVDLDPAVGKYHFMLANVLVLVGRVGESLRAADAGLAVCETDREELDTFRREVGARLAETELDPARRAFRAGRFVEARKALQAVAGAARATALWARFDGYVAQLVGSSGFLARLRRGKSASEAEPPGRPEDIRALYEYLVREELGQARKALETNQGKLAERVLNRAVEMVPRFALANLMLANAIYQRIGAGVTNDQAHDLKSLGAMLEDLYLAADLAEIGRSDPSLEDAPELSRSLEDLIAKLKKIRETQEILEADAQIVNQTMFGFIDILLKAQALRSRSDFESLYHAMQRLKTEVNGASRRVRSAQGIEVMGLIKVAVDRNFAVLQMVRSQLR